MQLITDFTDGLHFNIQLFQRNLQLLNDLISPGLDYTVLHFASLMNFRFLFVWAVLILLFGLIYTYIPDTKLKFTEQVPGACFAAVVWSVFSWGFSMYVSYGNGYSIYGSLTIIVIIMLWMYFCMYIILIGAYLNRYFRPVNRVLVNHASSKSELARENRRRIREIKKIQRRKKHYTEIDRNPKGQDENLTDRN